MRAWKLTKKQIGIRLILFGILLIVGVILLYIRSCPEWHDQVLMPPEAAASSSPEGGTQASAIAPPEGFVRVPADENSFLHFMRNMPVWTSGSSIMTYDGRAISSVNAAAVYTLSLPEKDLQQCADTVIRLWSEYFYATKQYDRIAFTYSNGFRTNYTDWSNGWRYVSCINWTVRMKLAGKDDSLQQMRNYLQSVMNYAGTLSLEAESHPITVQEARTGDIICKGGAPGHVVMIVDEAENAAGERCFLLAQGFMPSQSAHIIAGYGDQADPWYTEAELSADPIRLSCYTFGAESIRRWKDGFPNAAHTAIE